MLRDRVKQAVANPGGPIGVGSTVALGAAHVGFRTFLTAFGAAQPAYFVLSDGGGRALGGIWTVNGDGTATITAILINDATGGTGSETFASACTAWCAIPSAHALTSTTQPSANLPMNTFRHTNVGNATTRNEYAALGQVQDGGATWGGTAGGTANAITLALSPAITTYTAGMTIRFVPSSINSGATILNVNGVGAVAVLTPASAACRGGEIKNGQLCTVTYNGAAWILQTVLPMPSATTSAGIIGSIQALNSGTGSSLTLPAGGTWVAWWFGIISASGVIVGVPEMAEAAGGTTVKAGNAGVAFYGWAWRKA